MNGPSVAARRGEQALTYDATVYAFRYAASLVRFGLPSRSSPRVRGKVKKGPPPLKLRRDSLRSPLRCERRLEATGLRSR